MVHPQLLARAQYTTALGRCRAPVLGRQATPRGSGTYCRRTHGSTAMRIADVMTRDVAVVSPRHSLREAARRMDELNVGALPVCDGKRLVGILTDRDITVRCTAPGASPAFTQVHEAMT